MHFRIVIFISFLLFISCKHDHSVSVEKQKAFTIQKEALEELDNIDHLLSSLQPEEKKLLLNKKMIWEKNMVVIEGLDHDHSNCSHGHSNPTYAISDLEMIKVQEEWRDSILNLKTEIQTVLNKS